MSIDEMLSNDGLAKGARLALATVLRPFDGGTMDVPDARSLAAAARDLAQAIATLEQVERHDLTVTRASQPITAADVHKAVDDALLASQR